MPADPQVFHGAASGAQFTTTQWSVVLSARDPSSDSGQKALERLCCSYWPAVYSYLRRKGHLRDDAMDLAQEFFARILERETFGSADRSRGRFRSFLLECLHCFLVDAHRRSTRQKRGGGQQPISLDEAVEETYLQPFSPEIPPDELYDRRWRLILLQQALQRLEQEFIDAGKTRHFTLLKEFLTSPATVGAYDPIATALSTSARTIAVTIHRMRQRFRELVREELAQTVRSASEFDEELKILFG